ncbi:TPA: hypothetical protein JZ923_004456, partial [Escherichia coli]|nr:hypothetical protein [Escherichia coli]
DQISHATWTGDASQFPLYEELFTYDKNLNITRRQTRVNEVLESETHQQNRHGRVISSEHEGWRHSTHRINPQTGKPEEGKFVRVVNAHNVIWKYDINGRLVQKLVDKGGYRPLRWRYRWDARSQLTGLETPDGERWEYKYDPFGRRISKRCTSHNKPGMDFHWNGDQLTEEISVGADGTPEDENAIRWIYEPGDFTPFARYEKGQLHYAVTDTVGRVQELLTEEGLIVWKGKQQLWGREEGINKDDAPTCRLRFPGQYEDVESGLYYNRFRYYDCDTGQYLCADPIGLDGGTNLYGYVHNPLVWIDPLGLVRKLGKPGHIADWVFQNPSYGIHIEGGIFSGNSKAGGGRLPFTKQLEVHTEAKILDFLEKSGIPLKGGMLTIFGTKDPCNPGGRGCKNKMEKFASKYEMIINYINKTSGELFSFK